MSQIPLGKLVRVSARDVWPQERQFSAWLAQNIGLLNEKLGIEITLVEEEVSVGNFKVDLFGKAVGSGHEVIIENQLEPTNHSHLGQILTYGAGLDAKVVVWISCQFREEHRQAIDWLNFHTAKELSFFGLEIEVFRIGESLPAPDLRIVAQPNEWQPELPSAAPSTRRVAYHNFFTELLDKLKERAPGYTTSSRVGYDSWMAFGAGRSGFSFNPAFASGGRFRIELYIDTGNYDANKAAFDQLLIAKTEIEAEIGESLVWQRLDERRASRIYADRPGDVESPPDVLAQHVTWGVEMLVRFRTALGPRLSALDLAAPGNGTPVDNVSEND